MFGRLSTRSRAASYVLTAGFVALALGASSTAQAQSCQASGALSPFVNPAELVVGTNAEIDVQIANTSSTNPGNVDVAAVLHGTTVVQLACADSGCATPLPGTLVFDGCTFDATEVASCALDLAIDPTGNTVVIQMTALGVALGPDARESIAMIQTTATTPVPPILNETGSFFVRAATNTGDLMTDDIACNPQVEGEAGGSVTARFPEGKPFISINKLCSPCRPSEGDTAVATLTVSNSGDVAATNCVVEDIFNNGVPVIVGTVDVAAGASVELEFITPPFTVTTPNVAQVTCDAVCVDGDPDCRTENSFATSCGCGGFVPPCVGVECEICFPDDLKGVKTINP